MVRLDIPNIMRRLTSPRSSGWPHDGVIALTHAEQIMDRRKSLRVRTFLGAFAVFPTGRRLNCQVLDISAYGAKLTLEGEGEVPNSFELKIPVRGETYSVELRWQNGREMGVRFLSPEEVMRAENEQLRRWASNVLKRIRVSAASIFVRK